MPPRRLRRPGPQPRDARLRASADNGPATADQAAESGQDRPQYEPTARARRPTADRVPERPPICPWLPRSPRCRPKSTPYRDEIARSNESRTPPARRDSACNRATTRRPAGTEVYCQGPCRHAVDRFATHGAAGDLLRVAGDFIHGAVIPGICVKNTLFCPTTIDPASGVG